MHNEPKIIYVNDVEIGTVSHYDSTTWDFECSLDGIGYCGYDSEEEAEKELKEHFEEAFDADLEEVVSGIENLMQFDAKSVLKAVLKVFIEKLHIPPVTTFLDALADMFLGKEPEKTEFEKCVEKMSPEQREKLFDKLEE